MTASWSADCDVSLFKMSWKTSRYKEVSGMYRECQRAQINLVSCSLNRGKPGLEKRGGRSDDAKLLFQCAVVSHEM